MQIKTLLSYNDFSIFTIACEEAYNKSEELDACTLGCKSQVPHVVENQSQVIYKRKIMLKITDINAYDESVERYAGIADLFIFTLQDDFMDMMYPLMYVHSIYSSMLDRMYSGMSTSWSVYANNQRIIIVKSQPQFFAQIDSTDTDDGNL